MTTGLRSTLLLALTMTTGVGGTRPAAAQIDDDTRTALARFIEQHRVRSGWPGVAVSVATTDSVVFARGFGAADGEGGPITSDTPFFVGSVTKTFTAFAIVRLAEDGLLELDAPVERYLPAFGLRPPFVPESITVRHLLHHRSGLSQWSGHDERAQVDGAFDHLAPVGAPGGGVEYSSLNFIILGRVVEAVSGMTYGAFLEQSLFGPLGMEHAFADDGTTRPRPLGTGPSELLRVRCAGRRTADSAVSGTRPASLACPPARWASTPRCCSAAVATGAPGCSRPESAEVLFTPLDGRGPAMAWGRGEIRGTAVFEHAGNARTASARTRIMPESDLAISVMVNSNTGPFFDASAALSRVEVELVEPAVRFSGHGYHDVNAGDVPLSETFDTWTWSRARVSETRACLVYDVCETDGRTDALAFSVDASGATTALPRLSTVSLPRSRWALPQHTRADSGSEARLVRRLEDGPFYARSVIETTIDGQRCPAVHETLAGHRLDHGWVRFCTGYRMRSFDPDSDSMSRSMRAK